MAQWACVSKPGRPGGKGERVPRDADAKCDMDRITVRSNRSGSDRLHIDARYVRTAQLRYRAHGADAQDRWRGLGAVARNLIALFFGRGAPIIATSQLRAQRIDGVLRAEPRPAHIEHTVAFERIGVTLKRLEE